MSWSWIPRRRADRHFALTWTIGVDFGGLTQAMLGRSRDLVTHGGLKIDILTLQGIDDLDVIRANLTDRGLVIDGMRIRNLWEEIGEWPDDELLALGRSSGDPHDEFDFAAGSPGREIRHHEIQRADGTVLAKQTWIGDYAKPALIDRWGDTAVETTLFARDGRSFTAQGTHWLHHAWLDSVTGRQPATIVVDDAGAADSAVTYQRPHVSKVWVVHGNHLKKARTPPAAGLSDWRKFALERTHAFDLTVFLTQAQRAAVDVMVPDMGATTVIGHPARVLPPEPMPQRDERLGVTIGRLVPAKRVDHGVRAVAQLDDVRLAIHGTGPDESRLAELIETSELSNRVRLEGYSSDVDRVFASAGFSLLTSTNEAFGLVILESMASGCIPIAYDVPFGPSDLIESGVNGFLVRPGDIAGLSRAIDEVTSSHPEIVATMRAAARATAARFDEKSSTRLWLKSLKSVRGRNPSSAGAVLPPTEDIRANEIRAGRIRTERYEIDNTLTSAKWDHDRLTLQWRSRLRVTGSRAGATVSVVVVHRQTGARLDVPVTGFPTTDDDGMVDAEAVIPAAVLDEITSGVWTVLVQIDHAGIIYEETIRNHTPTGLLAPLPLAEIGRSGRVTVHRDHHGGLSLRRQRPAMIASRTHNGWTFFSTGGRPATEVAAVAGSRIVEATSDGAGRWRFEADALATERPTRWSIEARVGDEKRTKVAWSGASPSSDPAMLRWAPTEYGNLGVHAWSAAAVVTAVDMTDSRITLAIELDPAVNTEFAWVSATQVQPLRLDGPETVFDLNRLSEGRWTLRMRSESLEWINVLVAASAQAVSGTEAGGATLTVSRAGALVAHVANEE